MMESKDDDPIAVIGMGCRFSGGANSPETLWSMLSEGRSAWTNEVPQDRFNLESFYHPNKDTPGAIAVKGAHFLDQHLAAFDAGFFAIPPMEAEALDPQQRVVLEVAWEALENAGVKIDKVKGSDTAVFMAMFAHDFEQTITKDPLYFSKYHNTGSSKCLIANQISYRFDLHGPSVTLDTGCSGSLVAINSACQSLKAGEANMALAGGVGMIFSPDQLALMSKTGMLNAEGRCFAFDGRGDGFGRGEGVGVIALKRLSDAIRDGDHIRAIIQASGVNQDGKTNGITLPNQGAQESLARRVFKHVSFKPSDVQYVEAHGTGTKAGDAAEMHALSNVFCGDSRHPENSLYVGTVKPNLGHTEAASGAAGFIKTVFAMEKGLIPPNILLENLKPSLADLPWEKLKILQRQVVWPSTDPNCTRKAVVNSFGSGGTNAMVVLESAETVHSMCSQATSTACTDASETDSARLITLSARSQVSLTRYMQDLRKYLQLHPATDLNSLSLTLATRRSTFPWRSSLVTSNIETLTEALTSGELNVTRVVPKSCNILVFTGQGAQYHKMGHALLATESAFSDSICRSEQILKDFGVSWSLMKELSRPEKETQLNNSKFGQPASTAVQLGLVELLRSWNLRPAAVVGHSSGEMAAAFAAGVVSQTEALRIAYERSFLAEEAQKNSSQPGSMMAVGLGERNAQQEIDELGHADGQVFIACINSPSSTTVSGDISAILALKTVLQAKGVFVRQLKVDTAYHSHHMQAVSQRYFSRLEGLRAKDLPLHSSDPSCKFFSTVSGARKTTGFGPSYWVTNLVSPVRFTDAVNSAVQTFQGKVNAPLNFIEIGPHKTLGGPIRQSLAHLQSESLSYRYIPTLIRGENSQAALLRTGSDLIKACIDIDVDAVARLGLSSANKAPMLTDLPPYHWDHTNVHWSESRLSREYRFRKHAHHDLLGLRLSSSPDSLPSWRLILRRDDLPWLADHVVDNSVIFPGSGYVAMAVEAIRQLCLGSVLGRELIGYRIKDISFTRSLVIPDNANGVEVVLSLSQADHPAVFDFRVHSVSEESRWAEHCNGMIESVFHSRQDEVQAQREQAFHQEQCLSDLAEAKASCNQIISHSELYSELSAGENAYGPAFAAIREARLNLSGQKSLTKLVIPDIAAMMPSNFFQPHVIHPTSLDAILHISVFLSQRLKVTRRGSSVPVFIGEIFISENITSCPGNTLDVVCDLENTFSNSSGFNIAAYHEVDDVLFPVLTISDGEIRVVGESTSEAAENPSDSESLNVFKVQQGLDIKSLSATDLEALVIPLQINEIGISQIEKASILQSSAVQYILRSIKEVQDQGLVVKNDYRSSLFSWMQDFAGSDVGQGFLTNPLDSQETVRRRLSQLGIEGELLLRMGPNISSILTGRSDPLALLLENNFLYRVYENDECARANRYLAEYVKTLSFKKPGLRILELGAGTGGATLPVLEVCSADGQGIFCSEYMFTDVSSGFFEAAREKFKQWEGLIRFETLDLEADPIAQGFEESGYDLVLASNVVHATKAINRSLTNIRKLLRPGGVLALVEIVKVTPFHNATFGMLPGWWAGVEDGRKTSPLQTVKQWDKRLRDAKFSGVDIAARDFPEPATGCALLVSQSTPQVSNDFGPTRFELFNCLEDEPLGKTIWQGLQEILTASMRGCSQSTWQDDDTGADLCAVVIDAAERPVLARCSEDKFDQLISLFNKRTRVFWVTFSTMSKTSDGNMRHVTGPDSHMAGHGLVAGLARTALSERDSLKFLCVDVQDVFDDSHSPQILDQVTNLLMSPGHSDKSDDVIDTEYVLRAGKLYISRLSPNERLKSTVNKQSNQFDQDSGFEVNFHGDRALKVQNTPGVLSSLKFVDFDPKPDLGPDDVEVQPFAWGVNFKDVLVALGSLKATQNMAGECAGVVTRVGARFRSKYQAGQRVAMIYGAPPYSNKVVTDGHLIHTIPPGMSFADAATIPVAFATAYYGLVDCANLRKGQSVLIHAASGGLGQAAVMISQWIGATVFVTVGSKGKQKLLVEKFEIPDSNIFSSRTTDFKSGIMRLTKTQGVDVVLNSLSGEGLRASWDCIARMGTFVEVGKTDIYRRASLPMEVFDRNVRFASVDFVVIGQERPQEAQSVLRRVFEHFEAGHFSPLPTTSFQISEIEQAFRLLQSRQHTGKIVLEADKTTMVRANLSKKPNGLDSDGTYLIVGGLGSLGRQICRHMQANGAGHIVLVTRRQLDDHHRTNLEQELSRPGYIVKVVTCDILVEEDVIQMVAGLRELMPPLKGVIQGAMVIADSTLPHMDLKTFRTAMGPKYHGTQNLCSALSSELPKLQFFIMLSSIAAVLGLPGQSNYSAGNAYQDEFVLSQVLKGFKNFVSINLPLIRETETMSSETATSVARKGVEAVPISTLFSLLDYAMSGGAAGDQNNQILFGLSARSLQIRADNQFRITPMLRPVVAHGQKRAKEGSSSTTRVPIAETLAQATSMEEKLQIILLSIKAKVSSLIAMEADELSLDVPVASLGLDSLVSIELKNWITKALQAAVQTAEIMDSLSLKALARLVLQRTSFANKEEILTTAPANLNGTHDRKENGATPETAPDAPNKEAALPELPLYPLETTMEVFLQSVAHLGTAAELEATKEAVAELLKPGGIGQILHSRLECRANDPSIDNWLIDIYNRAIWLQIRDTGPRGHNFFGTHALGKVPHTQAERAALVSLAAYEYKLSIDHGTVPQEYRNELPLCMETIHWLFNATRVPQKGCDRVDRWPGNEYLVAMRRGHVWKIPLVDSGQIVSHTRLRLAFESILREPIEEATWAPVLTTGNRDNWAETREELITMGPENKDFISTIEKALFAVYLEETPAPDTANERGNYFLIDDNSNRWLDKTTSFIVCANGVSASFYEHAMIDGSTLNGLAKAIDTCIVDEHRQSRSACQDQEATVVSLNEPPLQYTYIPFTSSASIDERVFKLRSEHLARLSGYSFSCYVHRAWSTEFCRSYKLPTKSVFQMVIQIAVRLHFGYNPLSWDMVVQRQFLRGRFDNMNVQTAEVAAFCKTALDDEAEPREKRRRFLDAVRSHAQFVMLSSRGRGWMRHVMALKELAEPGDNLPTLYADPLYLRTRERKVFTSFGDSGVLELGNCWADRKALWISCEVEDEKVSFCVVNGENRAEEFVGHICAAIELVKGIIETK